FFFSSFSSSSSESLSKEEEKTKQKKLPVCHIQYEERLPGVGYRGVKIDEKTNKAERISQGVYKLSFWNLGSWRHYRNKIAKGEIAERMGYHAKLYHEQDFFTQVQMLFNSNPMSHGCWMEFELKKCKWIKPDEPDCFGGHSDTEWTEKKLTEMEE